MKSKIFYGWVIVGTGIVVSCVGFGAMVSLSIFLQPMAAATGWSRTGISTAATINWLSMGVGSFMWGALSDRLGTRAVVLLGGVLLGLGMVSASQATTLLQFQILFGVLVGVHDESKSRRRPGVRRGQPRLDDDRAAGPLGHHALRLAHGHAGGR